MLASCMAVELFITRAVFGFVSPIESPADLNSLIAPVNEEVVIIGGSGYSLSALDNIGATVLKIDGGSQRIALLVDGSFLTDNDFNTNLSIQNDNVVLQFQEAFLNGINGEQNDLVVFHNLSWNRAPDIEEENPSNDFVYEWGACDSSSGMCINRRYSASYLASHQVSAGLTGIDSMLQYTPSVLLRPVSAINQHELFAKFDFVDDYFLSVSPDYYNASDFNGIGLRLNSGAKVAGRLFVGATAYLSGAEFKYGVDDFDYAIYGGTLRVLYELNDVMFVRGVGGLSFAKIKSSSNNNPNVVGYYFGTDVGAKFNFESGLFLSPFVGISANDVKISNAHDNMYLLHAGTDVGFKYFMDGVSYSYNLRGGINSAGYLDAAIDLAIWTVADKIGGGISIGVVDTDFGWTGKFSANVKLAF